MGLLQHGLTLAFRSIGPLALFSSVLLGLSCAGGGNPLAPRGGAGQTVLLSHDGEQDSSPNLAGGRTWEAAARFDSAETAALVGGELTEVRFYILTVPDSCTVKIYGQGTATDPGALLYSADVTDDLVGDGWNVHVLRSPVTVIGGDVWIGIEFADTRTQPTIGCDPGPAHPDGNWLIDSVDQTWERFFVSVNWNIRGVVELPG